MSPPPVGSPAFANTPSGNSVPDFGHDAHVVQFYEQDRFLVEAVAKFLRDGIRAGEPLLVVATPEHRAALAAHLAAMGHEVDQMRADGTLAFFDAATTVGRLLVDGRPDRRRFREVIGAAVATAESLSPSGRLRVYGEMVDLLSRAANLDAAVELEQMWNELAREHSYALLCGYAMDNFRHAHDAARFADVCRVHSRVVPTESFVSLADPDSRSREPAGVKTPLGPFSDIIKAWHGQLAYDPGLVHVPIAIIRGEWDGVVQDDDARWLFDAFTQSPLKRDVKIGRATHLMHLETMRLALWQESITFLRGKDSAPIPA